MKNQSPCPPHLVKDIYRRHFAASPDQMDELWRRLNLRETFVEGQLFPYRVEFDAPEQRGPFQPGELNIHHGPLLSVHGEIGELTDAYRGLNYFYGSYVLSFRWIRPVCLEFYREQNGIRLQITSYVKPWIRPLWRLGNNIFWRLFGIQFLFKK